MIQIQNVNFSLPGCQQDRKTEKTRKFFFNKEKPLNLREFYIGPETLYLLQNLLFSTLTSIYAFWLYMHWATTSIYTLSTTARFLCFLCSRKKGIYEN